jgi:CheY-like chemotaxis protein
MRAMPKNLVIEDNEQNMYLCTFILNSRGHVVLQARSGREGIDMAVSAMPDLIILDIQLPEMDGYAVAREIKRNVQTKSIPVVAVTSYAMVGDRERVLSAGCEGYMEKPINPDTFINEISQHLLK